MNLNNIITNFKTMSFEVIHFLNSNPIKITCNVSPASSCYAKKSFSALRRVKTWLRNSIMQRRYNAIMNCNIHKEKLEELYIDDIESHL